MDQSQFIKKDLQKLYIALIGIVVIFGAVLFFEQQNGFVENIASRIHNATLISS